MYQMVENIKRPLKKGEVFLVPCMYQNKNGYEYITPVINHPHNDVENGQRIVHYHADYRFLIYEYVDDLLYVKNQHSKYIFCENKRPVLHVDGEIVHILLPVINEDFAGITSPVHIKNSKLKHDCVYKGKCPHRGYDLSQVRAINDVITCPLHGLRFDAWTGVLLKKGVILKLNYQK